MVKPFAWPELVAGASGNNRDTSPMTITVGDLEIDTAARTVEGAEALELTARGTRYWSTWPTAKEQVVSPGHLGAALRATRTRRRAT